MYEHSLTTISKQLRLLPAVVNINVRKKIKKIFKKLFETIKNIYLKIFSKNVDIEHEMLYTDQTYTSDRQEDLRCIATELPK